MNEALPPSPTLPPNENPKKVDFSPYHGSSIGPAERKIIPQAVYKDKVMKNFCTEAKTTSKSIREVFNEIDAFMFTPEITRLNIRIITKLDVLASVLDDPQHPQWRDYIEGVTPLQGCGVPELEDVCIINLGRMDPQRPRDSKHDELLKEVQKIYDQKKTAPKRQFSLPEGFEFRYFDTTITDPDIKNQFRHHF